jgi:hypothetical protein
VSPPKRHRRGEAPPGAALAHPPLDAGRRMSGRARRWNLPAAAIACWGYRRAGAPLDAPALPPTADASRFPASVCRSSLAHVGGLPHLAHKGTAMKILVFPAIGLAALLSTVPVWAAKPAAAKRAAKPAAAKPAAVAPAAEAVPAAPPTAAPEPPAVPAESANKPPDTKPAQAEARSKDVAAEGFEDKNSPAEKPGQTYYFVGMRARYGVIPKFMMSLFGDGGTTVWIPSIGPEFTIRKNGFEYVMSIQYTSYAMDWVPFKAKTDPPASWELVKSSLKGLYFMTDLLWSTELHPTVAIDYGAGIGIAAVFGNLYRVQAYPPNGIVDPYSYLPCIGQKNPHDFCGTDNNHYPGYSEPSWANGGSKPILFPWLSVQTGLRFKPHRHFMSRLDLGWNILNGPFIGIAGNYGI